MNQPWQIELFSRLVSLLIFGIIGYEMSGRFRVPRTFLSWTLLVAATVASYTIGTEVRVIGIDGGGLYLNSLLAGMGLGLIIGFRLMKRRNPVSTPGVAGQR